ncbi:MAG: peptidoglycan DD-metalloendopeptidase family protein [Candidatus Accumulibacter sp.]|jgi:septal ring factor EnvC (AmiA/AmiB activator)|nr:peptidoglycan DD-metalloendopeptidase family protein [Accumulibacter sp.]
MNLSATARTSARAAPRRIVAAFALSCAALAAAPPAFSGQEETATPTRAEVSEKRNDLIELRGQIESLRREMSAAKDQRVTAVDRLRDAERGISTTQREMRALGEQRERTRTALKELDRQTRTLTGRLDTLHAQMSRLILHRYLRGQPDALRLLLNDKDPNQVTRDLYYLGIIGQARRQLQEETETLRNEKWVLSGKARERAAELASIEARQKERHTRLVTQREQRKAALASISSKISRQRETIGQLQRDEQALTRLIARLDRIIAAQSASRKKRAAPPASPRPSGPEGESAPEALPGGGFAALKGRLRPPTRGTLANRYGGKRQEGSTWKGWFIRAAQGSEVKAVADGRVVFSDWMRGFGNLLIIDHGDAYLSIYAYNDAVLTQLGDEVRGGDAISTVGNSGGNPQSGLYFELRHQGRPVDPVKWVDLK